MGFSLYLIYNISQVILQYNYVMYKNKAYSTKWFYCFITDMKYIQYIAAASLLLLIPLMKLIVTLELRVNESMIVYTAFTRIMGEIIGKVIFQKFSQAVAPSILEASNNDSGIVCKAESKSKICRSLSIKC